MYFKFMGLLFVNSIALPIVALGICRLSNGYIDITLVFLPHRFVLVLIKLELILNHEKFMRKRSKLK